MTEIFSTVSAIMAVMGIIFGIYQYLIRKKIKEIESKIKSPIIPQSKGRGRKFIEKETDNFSKLDDRISKIETTLSDIKQLILENPETIISFAALKKDVDFIEKTLNRLDNSVKWFFGIIVTLSLGILGLAFSVLLNK